MLKIFKENKDAAKELIDDKGIIQLSKVTRFYRTTSGKYHPDTTKMTNKTEAKELFQVLSSFQHDELTNNPSKQTLFTETLQTFLVHKNKN